ncbi:hypothetical protein J3456_19370 [Sulfitobacter sp. NFXS29]|uniref:hypothetical protein n=1 Tax=Sulfitobacter sp. NFXS29 TaxID=2818438 RepID=UPI0032DFF80A
MTFQKQQNRVAELERKDGSYRENVYIWHSTYRPAPDGKGKPQIATAFGRGWSASRLENETDEEFKSRCVLVAAEAGISIDFTE